MITRRSICLLTLLFLIYPFDLIAQNPGNKISVSLENQRLDSLLSAIENKSAYKFSYNPVTIPVDSLISVDYQDASIKTILNDLLKFGISSSIMDEHIILKKAAQAELPREKTQIKEKHTLSGYIRDSESGEALIGATISDNKTGKGAMTNGYAYFSLTLEEGEYLLTFSFLGYKKDQRSIVLDKDKYVEIKLPQAFKKLEEVIVVSGSDTDYNPDGGTGEFYLKPSDVSNIQGFLGQSDVIKSLQTMPGINFYGDGSTIFHVRGGARDQNMILVDEAPVYNPAHMLGLFSVFTAASLNSIKVYKGNMPASFGGRVSSVIDVKLKEGNINGLSLNGNTGPIATTINIEGPLFNRKSTYYISARRSHFKWLFSGQNENIELLHFHDFNIKYNYRINNNNRIFLSVYSGADKFKNRNNNRSSSGIGWNNLAGNLRWNHVFGDRMFSNTSFIISNYDYNLHTSYEDNNRWNTGISLAALKTDFAFYASPGNIYRAGMLLSSHNYSPGNYYSGSNPDPLARGVPLKRADETAMYLDFENEILDGLRFNYGLRWTNWFNRGPTVEYVYNENYRPVDTINYTSNKKYNSYSVLEPRLNLSYDITGHITSSLSYTQNVQFEHLITNSISPFTSMEVWLPAGPNIKPASSRQVSLGLSIHSKHSKYSFDIELYNKVIDNYVSYVDHAYMLFNPHVEGELRYGRRPVIRTGNFAAQSGWQPNRLDLIYLVEDYTRY
ncbi:MAG: TonB-dependent receptor [Bacteroidales bacterium]|nr:TonB-dependent receptor [Bacteroidales bacterium]